MMAPLEFRTTAPFPHALLAALSALLLSPCGPALGGSAISFPSCQFRSPMFSQGPIASSYVRMRDGVRIAVDVLLPKDTPGPTYPAILEMTRYWRSAEGDPATEQERSFVRDGYAVVTGDVRGTGASFGIWPFHRSRAETLDFGELITWITQQPWSNGQVFGYGVSYSANTADWMVERQNPALKGIASRFPDYDPYLDLYFPGGVANRWMMDTWGSAVKQMDLNERRDVDGKILAGVRPVDSDKSRSLLNEAIDQRRTVPSVSEGLKQIHFRDDRPSSWSGASMNDWGIYSAREAVNRSQTPIESWASWYDAGTADGVLNRFMTQSNPQRAFVGAWAHGGYKAASPYVTRESPSDPPYAAQFEEDICFFSSLSTAANPAIPKPRKLLAYYTVGAERWNVTSVWPLPQARMKRWYFSSDNRLEQQPEDGRADSYPVDYSATTGITNRWHTNGGVPNVEYGDRSIADRKLLSYTSAPLKSDTEITGQPLADLYVTSDVTDAAIFIYLEDIDPHGFVRYLTEGELRLLDRKISRGERPYLIAGPYHSFLRKDALPMIPGRIMRVAMSMMPISVLMRAGHRLRIAVAGADADTFERVPETGNSTITIQHDRRHPTQILLPVIKLHGSATVPKPP